MAARRWRSLAAASITKYKRMPDQEQAPTFEQKAAIALHYEPGQTHAPVVVAAGQGHMADAIIAAARRHNVPLREDKALAGILAGFDLGAYIPPEMYRAVAEVLAWVYKVNGSESK